MADLPQRNDISTIAKPYLIFLGDVSDPLDAKTGLGIRQWRPAVVRGAVPFAGV